MNIITKANLLCHFLRWRLSWDKRDTLYQYKVTDNPRFMGPRDAVRLIKDGSVIGLSGLAGNHRLSIMYWAIRELFEETGHPRDLTFVAISALGGRGKVPGTLEEVGVEGLCKRLITGHTESYKAMLRLADAGKLELQCIPQGIMALLLAAMARGEDDLVTETGMGTYVDPRVGTGTTVCSNGAPQLVSAEDHVLRFTCPKPDVAMINAPAADKHGNIYMKNAVLMAEHLDVAKAARMNGGKVIANVGMLVDEGYDDIFLPAEDVDAVVVYPGTEQTVSVPHRKHWSMLTLDSDVSTEEGISRIGFINRLVGVTPKRTPVDNAVARLAGRIFVDHCPLGANTDIGVGLPEEVSRFLIENGINDKITLLNESGVYGGLAAPGIFFGASVNPTEIVSSAEAFRRMYAGLDAAILGMLQADSEGNVNVSRRGEGAINHVGPGGFIDVTACASLIVFIGSWMAHADWSVEGGQMRMVKGGLPKFVDKVDEVTFSGKHALAKGKRVFYATNVGAFRLTERGMELFRVMPGVDIQKDIVDACPMKVVLPEDGQVPVVGPEILTGRGYRLQLKG